MTIKPITGSTVVKYVLALQKENNVKYQTLKNKLTNIFEEDELEVVTNEITKKLPSFFEVKLICKSYNFEELGNKIDFDHVTQTSDNLITISTSAYCTRDDWTGNFSVTIQYEDNKLEYYSNEHMEIIDESGDAIKNDKDLQKFRKFLKKKYKTIPEYGFDFFIELNSCFSEILTTHPKN